MKVAGLFSLVAIFGDKLLACSEPVPLIEKIETDDEKVERKRWLAENKSFHDGGKFINERAEGGVFSEIEKRLENFAIESPHLNKRLEKLLIDYAFFLKSELENRRDSVPDLFKFFIDKMKNSYKKVEKEGYTDLAADLKVEYDNAVAILDKLTANDRAEFNKLWQTFFGDIVVKMPEMIKIMMFSTGAFADEKMFVALEQRLAESPQKILDNLFGMAVDIDKTFAYLAVLTSIRKFDVIRWFNELTHVLQFYVARDLFPCYANTALGKGVLTFSSDIALLMKGDLDKKSVERKEKYYVEVWQFFATIAALIYASPLNINDKVDLLGWNRDDEKKSSDRDRLVGLLNSVIKPIFARSLIEMEKMDESERNSFTAYKWLVRENESFKTEYGFDLVGDPASLLFHIFDAKPEDFSLNNISNVLKIFLVTVINDILQDILINDGRGISGKLCGKDFAISHDIWKPKMPLPADFSCVCEK